MIGRCYYEGTPEADSLAVFFVAAVRQRWRHSLRHALMDTHEPSKPAATHIRVDVKDGNCLLRAGLETQAEPKEGHDRTGLISIQHPTNRGCRGLTGQ